MCCGSRICMLCTCLVLLLVVIGFVFGFGVFRHGFHKIQDSLHYCDPNSSAYCGGGSTGRPFLIAHAPPPY